jgi:hypothetical protein
MSITVGLARKDLLTYCAYIFKFDLEEFRLTPRLETQNLTVFMAVMVQSRSPVREVVIMRGREEIDNGQHCRQSWV